LYRAASRQIVGGEHAEGLITERYPAVDILILYVNLIKKKYMRF
jgi:hypothetical protein